MGLMLTVIPPNPKLVVKIQCDNLCLCMIWTPSSVKYYFHIWYIYFLLLSIFSSAKMSYLGLSVVGCKGKGLVLIVFQHLQSSGPVVFSCTFLNCYDGVTSLGVLEDMYYDQLTGAALGKDQKHTITQTHAHMLLLSCFSRLIQVRHTLIWSGS